jgi:hypothetical protein
MTPFLAMMQRALGHTREHLGKVASPSNPAGTLMPCAVAESQFF